MTRVCFIQKYCFEKITGKLLIYKNNILIAKYTNENIPRNLKKIFNHFSIKDIEKYLIDSVPKQNINL